MKYPSLKPALEALKLKPPEAFVMSYSFPISPSGASDLIGHLYIHAFGPVQGLPHTADGEYIDYREKVSKYYSLPYEEVVSELFEFSGDTNIPTPFNNIVKFDTLIPPEHRKRIMLNTLEHTMHSGEVDFAPHILTYLETLHNNLSTTEAPSHGT